MSSISNLYYIQNSILYGILIQIKKTITGGTDANSYGDLVNSYAVKTSTGMLSDQSQTITFGLGRSLSASLEIVWMDGKAATVENIDADQTISLGK